VDIFKSYVGKEFFLQVGVGCDRDFRDSSVLSRPRQSC
jgi:hypothetical protein